MKFSRISSGVLVAVLCGLLSGCVGQGPIPGAFGGGGTSGGGTPSSGGSGSGGSGSGSPVIALSSTTLSFGQNGVGATSASQTLTLTNSGSSAITINSITASNSAFLLSGAGITSLAAGQSAQISVAFAPTVTGTITGTLTINSSAGNSPTTVALSGTGVNVNGTLTLSSTSFNFGQNVVGIASSPRTLVITNTGNGSATINSISVNNAEFAFTGATAPLTLAPTQSVSLSVTYTPAAVGASSGAITITSTAGNSPNTVQLSGSGATLSGVLSISSSTLNFGQNVVGVTSTPRILAITNTGNSSVNITSIASSDPDFAFTGATPPLTLAPTQSVSLTLTYTASVPGTSSGTLTITSTATNSPSVVQLNGSGVVLTGFLSYNTTTFNFGQNVVGVPSTARTLVITNTGSASTTVNSIVSNNAEFTFTGPALPTTLAPSQNVVYSLFYTPAAAAASAGTLTVTSTASNSPNVINLSGSGVAPAGTFSLSPTVIAFGQQAVGSTTAPQTITLTNTGAGAAQVSSITISNAAFALTGVTLPFSLSPGASIPLNFTFTPSSATAFNATVTISGSASNSPQTVSLSGSGVTPAGVLSVNPSSINFGNQVVGVQSAPQAITITNTGAGPASISAITSNSAAFSVSGLTLPASVGPGQSVQVNATYTPTVTGTVNAQVTITSTASNSPNAVALSGTGITLTGTYSLAPASIDFGQHAVGSSTMQTITVTNTGAGATQINSIGVSNPAFVLTPLALPVSLSPGGSIPLSFTFTPSSAATFNATVTITGTASNSPQTASLTGVGVTPAGTLSASPTTVSFGNQVVGVQSTAQVVTITNTGAGPASISAITFNNAAFSFSGLALPASVGPGQSVLVNTFFTPAATGLVNATMTITSTASNSPATVALDGTGIVLTGTFSLNTTNLNFGQQAVGAASSPQTVTVTNTGAGATQISSIAISNPAFTLSGVSLPVSLSPGSSINLNFVFTPTSAAVFNATATISGSASNSPQVINLTGTGVTPAGTFSVSPGSLSFGQQDVGVQSAAQIVTITNTGAGPASISALTLNNPAFSVSGLVLPASVGPSQSVQVNVQFTPTAVGPFNATLTITSTASNSPNTVALDGSGVILAGVVALNPTSLTFGQIGVGSSSSPQTLTITNTGNAPINISSITSDTAQFSVSSLALPVSVSPQQSTQVTVTFSPSSATSYMGTLTIISTASNSPTTLTMDGQGIGPQFTLSSASLNFGNQTVNTTSAAMGLTVTNVGTVNLQISAANVTPSPGAFVLAGGPTIPATVLPGNSVTFSITFRPDAVQNFSGFFNLTTNASATATAVPLSGAGIAGAPSTVTMSVSPLMIDFGQQLINQTSGARIVTLTSTGTAALTVSSISTSSPYAIVNISPPLPATLNPGQTLTFGVTFRPTSVATFDSFVTIVSNAPTTPDTVTLTGEGASGFGGCAGTLAVSPSPINFGSVNVGSTSSPITVTISNGGSGTMSITAIAIDDGAFVFSGITLPVNIAAGASVQGAMTFSPTFQNAYTALISFTSSACNPTFTAQLAGNGVFPVYTFTPANLNFGNQTVGTISAVQTVTLTNTGVTDMTINSQSITPSQFTVRGPTLPVVVPPSGTATFNIDFRPDAAQSFSGSFSVTTTGFPSSSTTTLSGTGTPSIVTINVTPTSIDFLNQPVNTSTAPRAVLITNSGSSVATISNVTTAAPFSVSGFSGSTTLNPGQTLTLNVTFTPTSVATFNGTLTITSNASSSPDVVTLRGAGIVVSGNAPYTAIDDLVIRQEPPLPVIGSAGFRFTEPTYGSRMLRVTDANTRPDVPNGSYHTPSGAFTNTWNSDTTKFYVGDNQGAIIPYNFDSVNMVATRMGNTTNRSGGLLLPLRANPEFSFVNPDIIYGFALGTNRFTAYRFSTGTSTVLHDPATCITGLTSFASDISITKDDQRLLGYLNGTGGNQQTVAYVFDRTLGCRWINTATGEIGGQWGPTGTISIPDRFQMHNARISRDGQHIWLERSTCLTTCSVIDYFWDLNTLTIQKCDLNADRCQGHKAMGFGVIVNHSATGGSSQWTIRLLSDVTNRFDLISPILKPSVFNLDNHPSWNNNVDNNQPFCLATFYLIRGTPIQRPWDEEIVCVRTDKARTQVWRFAHHRSTAFTFHAFPKGNVSQDGRFYMFNSDWEATVGTGRHDVFIIELK